MSIKQRWLSISVVGVLLVAGLYMTVRVGGQEAAPINGDFSNAATAEVRDSQGQVLLRGTFGPAAKDGDDLERKASLSAAGSDPDAQGEAEIEYTAGGQDRQELEFSIRNVQPGATYTLLIDGQTTIPATANASGEAEAEVEVVQS